MDQITVREIQPADREWVREFLVREAGATRMVSRGRLWYAEGLPGFIAAYNSTPTALLTYQVAGDEMEVATLHAAQSGLGLGSQLLEKARETALALGCRRLWLITTNDNDPAIRFYKSRGMRLVAVHANSMDEARKLKPEIPLFGIAGKPIRDEIEFEYLLQQ